MNTIATYAALPIKINQSTPAKSNHGHIAPEKGVTNLRRLNLRTIHVAIEAVVKRQFEEKHQKLREAACRSREATSTYVGYFNKK